jgi:hypothetical protein
MEVRCRGTTCAWAQEGEADEIIWLLRLLVHLLHDLHLQAVVRQLSCRLLQ